MRMIAAIVAVVVLVGSVKSQDIAKPGPEHEQLKKLEGVWLTTMKAGGMEHKGTVTFKVELGGLWLVGSLESELEGGKFYGRSMDSYDAAKKKYVSVWFDSMSTTPLTMEGDFDKEKNTLTMTGDGVGLDGKPAKWKSITEMKDENTMIVTMHVGDAKEPLFTVTYKRKK